MGFKRTNMEACDKEFKCELCDKAYSHKRSRVNHMKAKHSDYLFKAQSTNQLLTTEMEVLEEAGVTADLLGMKPMDESTNLEENVDTVLMEEENVDTVLMDEDNVDTVLMDQDDIDQYAITTTTETIETVLTNVHTETTVMTNTSQREMESFLTSNSWLKEFSHVLGPLSHVATPLSTPTPTIKPYHPQSKLPSSPPALTPWSRPPPPHHCTSSTSLLRSRLLLSAKPWAAYSGPNLLSQEFSPSSS